jgi:hypothetical protein
MCTMSAVSVALVVPFGCAQGAVTARGDVKEPPISRLASFSGAHVNSKSAEIHDGGGLS